MDVTLNLGSAERHRYEVKPYGGLLTDIAG
jgi:hypothetical protein